MFSSLNKLVLPEGNLKTIGRNSFSGISYGELNKVIIPSTVTNIENAAFSSMRKGSIINVNRSKVGMTLANSWSGNATVNYLD